MIDCDAADVRNRMVSLSKLETDTLASMPPRETAGSEAQRAFDFQIHVSMAHILETHEFGSVYIALFDHLDDLVLVVGEDPDVEISFYQVKSRLDGAWTPTRLSVRPNKGDLPRSIIGKAYYNIIQFGPSINRVAILSNQPLHAQLATGENLTPDDGEITLSELCENDYNILLDAIKLDFPDCLDEIHANTLRFQRVPFDLQSFRDTILGRVIKFVENLGPDMAPAAKPFYDALLSEVGRCTGVKLKAVNFFELKKRKGIARSDLDNLIGRARQRVQTVLEWWPSVQAELAANGQHALGERRMRKKCLEYWRARERGASEATKLHNEIRASINRSPALQCDSVLQAATITVLAGGLTEPDAELYDLQSALIVELMELMT